MTSILTYVDLTVVGYVAVFVATLVFAQKIKDFFAGVPADLRSSLQAVEASVKADVKTYQASVIAKLTPPDPAKQPALAPAAPAAPTA